MSSPLKDFARALGELGKQYTAAQMLFKQKELDEALRLRKLVQELARKLNYEKQKTDYEFDKKKEFEDYKVDELLPRKAQIQTQAEVERLNKLYGSQDAPGLMAEQNKAFARTKGSTEAELGYTYDPRYQEMQKLKNKVVQEVKPDKVDLNFNSAVEGFNNTYNNYIRLMNKGAKDSELAATGTQLLTDAMKVYSTRLAGLPVKDGKRPAAEDVLNETWKQWSNDPKTAIRNLLTAKVGDVYVLPSFQRQGIMKIIMDGSLDEFLGMDGEDFLKQINLEGKEQNGRQETTTNSEDDPAGILR